MESFFDDAFWQRFLEQVEDWVINSLPSVLALFLFYFVTIKLFRFLVRRIEKFWLRRNALQTDGTAAEDEKRILTLMDIVRQTGRVAVMGIFLVALLSRFGIDIMPLLAGAGVLGLAIGFGAQELVRDIISGFFILLENHVRTGDVAIINGTGGLVEEIELRTITLRDLSGTVHIFQNGKINTLSNMTKEWSAMVFDIGVAYKEDVDKVIETVIEEAAKLQEDPEHGPNILEPLEMMGLDSFGDSAVVIKCRFKTKPITQWAVGREFRKRLKYRFDKEGIEIPFPHTTIYWGEASGPLNIHQSKQ